MFFWMLLHCCPSIDTLSFGLMKGVTVVHINVSFMSDLYVLDFQILNVFVAAETFKVFKSF